MVFKIILTTASMMLPVLIFGLAIFGSLAENNPTALEQAQTMAAEVATTGPDQVLIGGNTFIQPLNQEDFYKILDDGPNEMDRAKIEFIANKFGPFSLNFEVHKMNFFGLQFFIAFYLLWKTLGIFMIGAGLVKNGILSKDKKDLWKKTAIWGIGIGLPFSALATYFSSQAYFSVSQVFSFGDILHSVSALPLAFGFAALVMLWSQSRLMKFLQDGFAGAGRMALTNYLGQSFVVVFIAKNDKITIIGF